MLQLQVQARLPQVVLERPPGLSPPLRVLVVDVVLEGQDHVDAAEAVAEEQRGVGLRRGQGRVLKGKGKFCT